MNYQPEERYWTDYVRVALPIIGLLVLLGVFWYWASSLIGSASQTEPTARATVEMVNAPTNTPSPTEEVQLPVETAAITPDIEPTEEAPPDETRPPTDETPTDVEPTPTEEEAEPTSTPEPDEKCIVGGTVVVNDNDVRMRDQPSLDGAVIDELSFGDELVVVGPSAEGDSYIWCNVEDVVRGFTGYVADEFLEAQS